MKDKIQYKGKGEHSINELERIIEQREEEIHLLNSSKKSKDCSLDVVSIKSLKAKLKVLIFSAREDWAKFDSEGNEFASRKAYGQFIAYKNLHDGINNGAFKD